MTNNPLPPPCSCFELRFDSLFQPGCDLAFACDSEGHVDDEHFSSSLRSSYLFARALVGRKYQLAAHRAARITGRSRWAAGSRDPRLPMNRGGALQELPGDRSHGFYEITAMSSFRVLQVGSRTPAVNFRVRLLATEQV